jgi:endonuclease/exonuclease/phosphatase (EEP) superfamily protein YafD
MLKFLKVSFAISALLYLLSYTANWLWLGEVLVNFQLQFAVIFALFATVFLFKKVKIFTLSAFLFIIPPALQAFLVLLPTEQIEIEGEISQLKVQLINVWSGNTDYEKVQTYIKTETADILIIVELTPSWAQAMNPLKSNFVEWREDVRTDNFGLGIYSKVPLINIQTHEWSETGHPSFSMEIVQNGKKVNLIATHPYPPKHPNGLILRTEHFENMTQFINEMEGPIILMGDLNCSPYSPHFKTLLAETDLSDSRKGYGIQATWPALFLSVSYPIDHALMSREFRVINRDNGPKIGSDHLPIILTVQY